MATSNQNLSEFSFDGDCSNYRIGLVASEWNEHITNNLLQGARSTLIKYGVKPENIVIKRAPGTYELPLLSQWTLKAHDLDGIIAIGSVIQGETRHFDFVCNATAKGLMDLNLKSNKPVIFCVLTDNNEQQAIERSGGIHGNKGDECAIACLKMISLNQAI